MKKQQKRRLVLREFKKLEKELGIFIPTEELENSLKKKLDKKELETIIKDLVEEEILHIPRKGFVQRFETKSPIETENLAFGSQSEKISYLIAEIGKLTIQLQNLEKEKWDMNQKLLNQEKENHKFKLDVVKYIMEN
jgi:hypothetical protein